MAKEYPLLIGCEFDKKVELHNKKEVAEYICKKGLEGNVYITYPDGRPMLDTFGIYINKIDDMEYRSELLKELIPMQINLEKECFHEDYEEDESNENLEMDLT